MRSLADGARSHGESVFALMQGLGRHGEEQTLLIDGEGP